MTTKFLDKIVFASFVAFFLTPVNLFSQTWLGSIPSEYWIPTYVPTSSFDICYHDVPWKLVFQDEFNGTELNSDNWVTYYPYSTDGSDQCPGCRTDNQTNAIYRDENVSVSDGQLHLLTRSQQSEWYGVTKPFTSGMIRSINPWKFTRGKFEMGCRIPYSHGAPLLFPAFWLYGSAGTLPNTVSELDVFEFCGNQPNAQKATMHRYYGGERYSSGTENVQSYNFADEFHVFAVTWDLFYVRWYVDWQLVREISSLVTVAGHQIISGCNPGQGSYLLNPYFPHNSAQLDIIANSSVAPEGGFCGSVDEMDPLSLPLSFDIEYIRVFERQTDMHHPALNVSAGFELVSDTQVLCEGDETTIRVTGVAGNLWWGVGEGLEITERKNNTIKVRALSGSFLSHVEVLSWGGPTAANNGSLSVNITVGKPNINTALAWVQPCGHDATFVCHAHPTDAVDHKFFVDGVQLTHSLYDGVVYENYPTYPIVYYQVDPALVDFCLEYEMRVENECGMSSATGTLKDDCIIGECDLIGPDVAEVVSNLITTYPNPTVTIFDLVLDEKIDPRIVLSIAILDSGLLEKWRTTTINSGVLQIPSSGWTSGLYYVHIELKNTVLVQKLQLKF